MDTAALNKLRADLAELRAKIESMRGNKLPPRIQFPEQFKAGVVGYPDLEPYPFTWGEVELVESGSAAYATTGALCTAAVRLDDIYSYITHISFHMVRTAIDGGKANVTLNTWLPLSGTEAILLDNSQTYNGKDFRWRVKSDASGLLWQSQGNWRASSELIGFAQRKGYKFDVEYNAKPNDIVQVEVQPIEPTVGTERFRLYCSLHGYKMRASTL